MVFGVIHTMWADISVQTKIFDPNSQPPIVGGIISGSSEYGIAKKGLLVSVRNDDLIYDAELKASNPYFYEDLTYPNNTYSTLVSKEFRIIDCSNTGKEQFWCPLLILESQKLYYVKAYVVNEEGNVIYGQTESLTSQSFNRYSGRADYANVWHAFEYSLFDLVTDEVINPNDGFYYSTNENPKTVRHQVGTSYNTCYKFATEWNYKLWYYHSSHCDREKMVCVPFMSYENGKLSIEKNTLDSDKDITIYYSINGNYFRPETYTAVYTAPIEITEPCTVYCYAISSEGYISYTSMYVVGDYMINENEDDNNNSQTFNSDYVEVCGVKWARGNLQYDTVNGGDNAFQENWRIAPNQWHFFHYDEGATSYNALKTDKQIDHFTWGVCGDWDFLHDVTIYSSAQNTDINSKIYLDADCKTETSEFENAKYGDIAYWASNGHYRLPTADEIDILINKASYQYGYYVTNEGIIIHGCLFITPNSNIIRNRNEIQLTDNDLASGLFLPTAGGAYTNSSVVKGVNNGESSYWTSTVERYPQAIILHTYPTRARYNSYYGHWPSDLRSVRPVYVETLPILDDNGDVDYGNGDVDEGSDLSGNVIGNIYYNISDDNGEYSSTEGCIILRKPTSDTDMNNLEGQDIFGEDFKNGFTGIVFMVQAGSGTIKVNAESVGSMTLKVKIGKNAPMTFELEGKMKVSIPYSVTEPTYVYIYGGETTANARGLRAASSDNALKIYGIEWSETTTNIESILDNVNTNAIIYNLQGQRMKAVTKGINIINGKKVIVK